MNHTLAKALENTKMKTDILEDKPTPAEENL